MPQYYLWFAIAVIVFVLLSFVRSLLFWKRVARVRDVSELSAGDQKLYEKYKTQWPHDKLAIQKTFETKLMLIAFVVILIISLILYWFLATKW